MKKNISFSIIYDLFAHNHFIFCILIEVFNEFSLFLIKRSLLKKFSFGLDFLIKNVNDLFCFNLSPFFKVNNPDNVGFVFPLNN